MQDLQIFTFSEAHRSLVTGLGLADLVYHVNFTYLHIH